MYRRRTAIAPARLSCAGHLSKEQPTIASAGVAYDDYRAALDSGRDWLEAFVFVDVQNRDRSEHLVARLRPGVRYAFIVGSNVSRYGAPNWSSWASHTLAEAPVEVGPSGLATPEWIASSGGLRLGTVNLSWLRVAGADSYLLWYSTTNGDDHRWAWVHSQSTIVVDLEPGLVYRFAVAAAKTDAEGNFVYSPFSDGVIVRATWDADAAQSSDTFSEVTVGDVHSCGLSVTGAVQCWGDNTNGQLNAPSGRFVSVQAGSYHTCALRIDGSAVCWGDAGDEGKTSPPDETFTQISVGSQHGCGLTAPPRSRVGGAIVLERAVHRRGRFSQSVRVKISGQWPIVAG